jgi:hypothetical protein
MKNFLLASVVFLSLAFPLYAQTKVVVPDQKPSVPLKVDKGGLIVLSVPPITKYPDYLSPADVQYMWKITERIADGTDKSFTDYIALPDGRLFWGAGVVDKSYNVYFMAHYLYKVPALDKDGKPLVDKSGKPTYSEVILKTSDLMIFNVKVGNPAPNPNPNPNPNPPVPGPDDGAFKLATTALTLATNNVMEGDLRAKGAKALATSFRGIASAAKAGTIASAEDLLVQTKTANNTALINAGISPTNWDKFGVELEKVLYALYKDKKLNTVSDYAQAWNEIANGLDKVQ